MKSKAVFILPPTVEHLELFKMPKWQTYPMPPTGLIAIASFLRANGHEAVIVDCRELIWTHRTSDYIPILVRVVEESGAEFIGISILSPQFNEALKISAELKRRLPDCLLVAGGPHPSVEPLLTFRQNPFLDAVCIGAGEEVCLDIMDGKTMNAIKGLMRRDCPGAFEKRTVDDDIDKYPFPDFSTFNVDFYLDLSLAPPGWVCKHFPVMTSRGCPYSCKFCASEWSKPVRLHSPEYVVDLARHVSSLDIDVICILDDTISASRDRLERICEGFLESRLFWPHGRLRWYAMIRADQVDPSMLKLMKKAGCFSLHIGVESGSDRMLKLIDKRTSTDLNGKACAYVKEAGLHLSTSYIIGFPGETEPEMLKTISFMEHQGSSNTRWFFPLQCLPGSPFFYELIETGRLSKEDMNWPNLSELFNVPELLFCDVARDRFKELLDQGSQIAYSQGRFVSIFGDTFLKHPEMMAEIVKDGTLEVRVCQSDNYESSTHIPIDEFLKIEPELAQFWIKRPTNNRTPAGYGIVQFLSGILKRMRGLRT